MALMFQASVPSEMQPPMILSGGKGARLRDVTELLPKPKVPIGEQPIVWHIMRSYAAFGGRRFILCLGNKVLAYDGPVVCDVMTPEWQLLIPRASSEKRPDGRLFSRKIEDMFPYLPEAGLRQNMIAEHTV